jgi:hypothetical protein
MRPFLPGKVAWAGIAAIMSAATAVIATSKFRLLGFTGTSSKRRSICADPVSRCNAKQVTDTSHLDHACKFLGDFYLHPRDPAVLTRHVDL